MRSAVAARPDEAWGATVYDAWLDAVEPMWLPHGAAFPDFMQTDAWKAKSQQTGFGSYAELKHDTILYTKQAVGEMGRQCRRAAQGAQLGRAGPGGLRAALGHGHADP